MTSGSLLVQTKPVHGTASMENGDTTVSLPNLECCSQHWLTRIRKVLECCRERLGRIVDQHDNKNGTLLAHPNRHRLAQPFHSHNNQSLGVNSQPWLHRGAYYICGLQLSSFTQVAPVSPQKPVIGEQNALTVTVTVVSSTCWRY